MIVLNSWETHVHTHELKARSTFVFSITEMETRLTCMLKGFMRGV